jgi:hypothetical protein
MQMARVMLSQSGKRRKERAGKNDEQFVRTKRKGSFIGFIFGIYTANLHGRQCRLTTPPLVLVNCSAGRETEFSQSWPQG